MLTRRVAHRRARDARTTAVYGEQSFVAYHFRRDYAILSATGNDCRSDAPPATA